MKILYNSNMIFAEGSVYYEQYKLNCTIGREYGSGGRQIGRNLLNILELNVMIKELLEHAANDSGICKELFEHHDEKPTNSFLYSLVMDTYSFGYSSSGFSDMPMNHKIFLAQFDAIKNWQVRTLV